MESGGNKSISRIKKLPGEFAGNMTGEFGNFPDLGNYIYRMLSGQSRT